MKNLIQISKVPFSVVCFIVFLITVACDEDKEEPIVNKVVMEASTISNITNIVATVSTPVIITAGAKISQHGHCWGTQSNPDLTFDHTSLGALSSATAFQSYLVNLLPGKTYYARPYVIENSTTTYGPEISFVTIAIPSVTTTITSDITTTSAKTGGYILNNGASAVIDCGICWSKLSNPTLADNVISKGNGIASFEIELAGLTPNSRYFVRTYATNSFGTAYGNEVSFTTLPDNYYIGMHFGGGIVFYIDSTGCHGYISAATDQGFAAWGCSETYIGNTSTSFGTGKSNTGIIVNNCNEPGAARSCSDLILNGFDDWFLPSRDELILMYQNKDVIGGFSVNNYWSSSETNAIYACRLWTGSGSINTQAWKYFAVPFRAVRTF